MKINLIPMAGDGSRFKKVGIKTPKPLLITDNEPMFVKSAKSLPSADLYIFVCRSDHIINSNLKELININFSNNIIIEIDKLTKGQASTCMLAKPHIDKDAILTIGACDNDMIYSESVIDKFNTDENVDGLVWTFKNNISVLKNPNMYGWVKTENDINALGISCKVPISDNPINDHAVVGAFSFKKAECFFESYEKLINDRITINGEYYIDSLVDLAIKNGNNFLINKVDKYICWGTPDDYNEYRYWLEYFKN